MRAATCSERTNPIRMRDFARLTFCYDEIFARHGSPGDIGRARASPAIDAMTIDQSKRPTLQHVSCPAANASTTQFHIVRLAHFNHEFTRINKNLWMIFLCLGSASVSRATDSPARTCDVPLQRTSREQTAAQSFAVTVSHSAVRRVRSLATAERSRLIAVALPPGV
jgi:hypothetical protein